MTHQRFTKQDSGVSPVIAIILMIAITIVLTAVLNTWTCGGFRRSDVQTPTVGALYQPDDVNFTIHIEKIDPDPTHVWNVNYILLDERGTAIPGVQGSMKDILNLDPDHEYTNITFYDNDGDEMLSAGDVFWIKNADFGGQARVGYSLLLKFEITGDKMNGRGTILE
jgi:flagellin-like protein